MSAYFPGPLGVNLLWRLSGFDIAAAAGVGRCNLQSEARLALFLFRVYHREQVVNLNAARMIRFYADQHTFTTIGFLPLFSLYLHCSG